MLGSILLIAATLPAGHGFACTPVAVWDGDGPIWCEEGPRIRLAGIAAREMDGTCSSGHPCPSVDARQSRDALVGLVGVAIGTGKHGHILVRGPTMHCISEGSAGGNRIAARCTSPRGGELSCAMVRSGFAARWQRFWRSGACS